MVLLPIFDVGCHDAYSHRSRSPSAGESRERYNHIMSLVSDLEVACDPETGLAGALLPRKSMNLLNPVKFIDGEELGSEFAVTSHSAQSDIWG
jgi:hypothetical protein